MRTKKEPRRGRASAGGAKTTARRTYNNRLPARVQGITTGVAMGAPTRFTTGSTTSSTVSSTTQLRPESDNYSFIAPRTEGAPYPRYSLKEVVARHLDGKRREEIPKELDALDEGLVNHALAAEEHSSSALAVAGQLYRAIERQETLPPLDLCRALCILLHELDCHTGMIQERMRINILKAFGEEAEG